MNESAATDLRQASGNRAGQARVSLGTVDVISGVIAVAIYGKGKIEVLWLRILSVCLS
jgi:hypothetical protein